MLSRDGQGKVGHALFVFTNYPMSYFPQLTLFPRISKTFETDLGHILAFFGEHFLKQ